MLPALIGAGASLLGGLLGQSGANSRAAAEAARQKEFAQQGIRWRVDDAKAAGIHPLAALGAQTHAASPIHVGDSIGPAVADMGQDISRAIDAKRTASERVAGYEKTVQELSLQRMGLENQLLTAQIAKVYQAGHPPGMPELDDPEKIVIAGQPVKRNPMWSDARVIQDRYGEPAEYPYFPFVTAGDIGYNVGVPSPVEMFRMTWPMVQRYLYGQKGGD